MSLYTNSLKEVNRRTKPKMQGIDPSTALLSLYLTEMETYIQLTCA